MIDRKKLQELLAAPNATLESIYSGLGYNNQAALYYYLKKDPEVKALFAEWRATHKRTSAGATGRSSKSASTPRNGNAKPRVSDELLRKIKHEFEHVSLYQQVSEFFDDVAAEVAAIR